VKLLFVTQVLDSDDAVLGFVMRWVQGLARCCERVRVVALEVGALEGLPENVDVRVVGRKGYVGRWLRYRRVLREAFDRDELTTLLAHMVPRYATVGIGIVRSEGGKSYLWYTHKSVDGRLIRAEVVVEKIFTASAESLRLKTPKKVVTGHGIDLVHFDSCGELPADPPRLLSVGRLTPAKDPLTLIHALSILVARGHDLGLDLVGGGLTAGDEAYAASVRAAIEERGLAERVHLVGAIPYREIPAWFRRSTLVLSASRTGSVDKTVLEAMACSRPVITCNESFPALFAELGAAAAGLAFHAGDAEELVRRVESLLALAADERRELGAKLRALVERDHEVDRLMERLVREMGGGA
jgi:glycosyltransferase involved in cell wall biosynthesis